MRHKIFFFFGKHKFLIKFQIIQCLYFALCRAYFLNNFYDYFKFYI